MTLIICKGWNFANEEPAEVWVSLLDRFMVKLITLVIPGEIQSIIQLLYFQCGTLSLKTSGLSFKIFVTDCPKRYITKFLLPEDANIIS